MTIITSLFRDERGATVTEFAFAFPVLIVLIWMIVQLGFVLRANAGVQQALGEGARFATLCLSPTILGCTPPTRAAVKARMEATVDGAGMGTFEAELPVAGSQGGASYYDLKVNYSMPTSLILFPGPRIAISKSKRVWIVS
jgi:Flp pilus assembly pilin Flp